MTIRIPFAAAAFIAAAAATSACNKEPEVPAAQSQTQSQQQLNTPATLTGCLRAGEAANTFVLTASAGEDAATPATYQLMPTSGVALNDHVGHRIEVQGVVEEQKHVATTEAAKPADEKATGTSGTPTVQTGTQLALRTMQVNSVRPIAGSCE